MSLSEFAVVASEAGGEGHSPWPYVVGGVVLLIFLLLLAGLLAFAGGREHS
ncbi:hypothetical protein QE364_001593 [Nocardioides zeae]|jgi:hypothetical protein|nr:hypothetical protein [Nocardioides zeae]MDR6172890.1 hypothetical protein [Nocardioides zeae]MDR6209886.1 hypothetical protein [Nocardioides zeae]